MINFEQALDKLWRSLIGYLPMILLAVVVFSLFYFIGNRVRKISLKFYTKYFKTQKEVANVISFIIYILFLAFGGFTALDILGLDSIITKMLAGAGVLSIVAGFAFKEIGSNMFSGILLNAQCPFKVGDWVEINGVFGQIVTIGGITTSIKTTTGQEVFVPNQLVYQSTFTNYSSYAKRRVVLKSGVSYGDDLDLVKQTALDEVGNIKAALKDEPIDFYFTEIGSSSYNFELRFWINFETQTDYLEAMNETITRIKKRFESEEISLAYAVMTLDFGVKGGVNLFDKPIKVDS